MKRHVIGIVVIILLLSTAVAVAANESSSMDTLRATNTISPTFLEGSGSITTLFAGGNGQSGNMFDFTVIGPNPVTITSFDINVDNTNAHTAEVYYVTGGGTYAGNETNAAAWTMLGTAGVTGAGPGNPTPLPVGGLTVNPGETYGLYVTMSTCTCIDYSNGPLGPYSNADVQLDLGTGNAYPFGSVFSPRIWNGTVYYDIGTPAVPSVQIEKSPDFQNVLLNDTADFTIAVTNTGTVTLTNVLVADALTPDCDNSLGTMVPGASTTYSCSNIGVTTSFTNTAVVSSTYNNGPGPSDSDDAYIEVVDAALEIEKSPDYQAVLNGGTAAFTITITNSGSVQVNNVTVSDALVPACDNAIGAIPGGVSVSYVCSDVGVTTSYTNTAVVTGVVDFPVPTLMASDDAYVEAVDAALEIEKSPDYQAVIFGGTADFTITVTNSGSVQLNNVTVSDALVPACDNAIGAIPGGVSVSYVCSDVGVTTSYTNTAVVTGVVDFPVPTLMASDDAYVEVNQATDVNLTQFGQTTGASSPLWLALVLGIGLGFGFLIRRRLRA